MKKIFILPILIAPIVAHATDPVGPAAASGTPVVATASAPYATATAENGDTTNVVSASYVKGAYNDAIAAINNVAETVNVAVEDLDNLSSQVYNDIDGKQDKLVFFDSREEVGDVTVAEAQLVQDEIYNAGLDNFIDEGVENSLVTVGGVAYGVRQLLNRKAISAVTTWGSNTTTGISLINN